LLGQGNIGAQLIFPKYLFWAYIGGLKVKSVFSTYFSIESSNPKKYLLHFKPCLMTSLSSRKSWEKFALSIEKIDFLIFSYLNLRAGIKIHTPIDSPCRV
jgi:hypothetical protein